MILPLGDSPNPQGVPVVTYGLLALNVAIYVLVTLPLSGAPVDPHDPLLMDYLRVLARNIGQPVSVEALLGRTSAYDLFVFAHGFRPASPSLEALFASMFLHGGFAHLAGNMLFLWIYGDNVEHRLGKVRYLLAYLGTGVAATSFHALFDLHSELPLVGASGAISGVLGFYFLWFPRNQVRLLLFLFPFLVEVVTVPARVLLGLYLIVDNLLPFVLTRGIGGGGVAHGAHLGGFLGGLALAWLLNRREAATSVRDIPVGDAERTAGSLRQALAAGDFAAAASSYFRLPSHETHGLLGPAESLLLADWLRSRGHDRAALTLYRRHLRDYPRGPGAAEAHFGAGTLQLESFDQPAAAYQHFLDALEFEPSVELAERVRAALAVIESRQKYRFRPRRE